MTIHAVIPVFIRSVNRESLTENPADFWISNLSTEHVDRFVPMLSKVAGYAA